MITEAPSANSIANTNRDDMQLAKRPSADEIEKFSQVFSKSTAALPDESLVNAIQQQNMTVDQTYANAWQHEGLLNKPVDMLMMQKKVLHTTGVVELTAKVAGSLSQSINKLINLQ